MVSGRQKRVRLGLSLGIGMLAQAAFAMPSTKSCALEILAAPLQRFSEEILNLAQQERMRYAGETTGVFARLPVGIANRLNKDQTHEKQILRALLVDFALQSYAGVFQTGGVRRLADPNLEPEDFVAETFRWEIIGAEDSGPKIWGTFFRTSPAARSVLSGVADRLHMKQENLAQAIICATAEIQEHATESKFWEEFVAQAAYLLEPSEPSPATDVESVPPSKPKRGRPPKTKKSLERELEWKKLESAFAIREAETVSSPTEKKRGRPKTSKALDAGIFFKIDDFASAKLTSLLRELQRDPKLGKLTNTSLLNAMFRTSLKYLVPWTEKWPDLNNVSGKRQPDSEPSPPDLAEKAVPNL